VLLRRTYREGGKVEHETLANLSKLPKLPKLPQQAIEAIGATLRGVRLVPADQQVSIERCRTDTWRR
jgi:hypothetical protein